ncbi:hypothetical protein M0812_18073 [Anaeramoeba flamelloides]|uniref:Endonuclease/exonuclease/phosphatase domain-containing protein n=1 Tax=Anaeramoeba flamelloides TaxID=1746091 RepID=A0AAV7Z7H8_9EUKA|nr:hypothetical protein M0812_18073 [Anaeramoeba flamelloides]
MSTTNVPLSVATFNILAPCYKRINFSLEKKFEDLYVERAKDTFKYINTLECDVICLQEVWFSEKYLNLLSSFFENEYVIAKKKRTRSKSDGVVILVKKSTFTILEEKFLEFGLAGNRVALLIKIKSNEQPEHRIVIANTHLTFPHHTYDVNMRLTQIQKLQNWVKNYNQEEHLPIIIAGDLNGVNDNVYNYMTKKAKYTSSFKKCREREARVTHFTHRKESVGVDFLFLKNFWEIICKPIQAWVEPKELTDKVWPENFNYSDHRPVKVNFSLEIIKKK